MTRKEAIYEFQDVLGELHDEIKITENLRNACRLALKALEQEPCEDVVSRQYLIDIATKNGAYDYVDYVSAQEIANAPSVNPQPKTGHWILTDVEGNRVWHCRCSECDKDPQDYIGGSENWWLIKNNLPKACPNCGAKMVEPQESEDEE